MSDLPITYRGVRFFHEMHNEETGEVSAISEMTAVHLDTVLRETEFLSRGGDDTVRTAMCAVPAMGSGPAGVPPAFEVPSGGLGNLYFLFSGSVAVMAWRNLDAGRETVERREAS